MRLGGARSAQSQFSMHFPRSLAVLSFLVSCASALADVTLAPVFTDHAVLQREKPVPVWGKADAGERVVVSFAGQSVGTTAGKDGRWIVYLAPLTASATPAELVVAGKNTLRLTDVLVGDVWLLSGQSNMEWPVERAMNWEEEVTTANFPLIRHIKFKKTVALAPMDSVENDGAGWRVCTPEVAKWFSAVGFFFARDLQPRIGVPVGLINSTYGGTPVEGWMSEAALGSDPAFAVVGERWQTAMVTAPEDRARYDAAVEAWKAGEAAAKAKGEKYTAPWPPNPASVKWFQPSGLFNGMIAPILPVAIKGGLWYQGETNGERPEEYRALFSSMITHWRAHLGQGDVPFFWVQLANFGGGYPDATNWAKLRDAQTETLALPATGQAVAIDIGDADDIHPTNKQEVGRRLALIARAKVYGGSVDFSGPVFKSAVRDGAAMRVSFDFAGNGLIAKDKPLQSFQVAGADQKFFPAMAKIEGETLIVSAAEVPEPVAVRYAWTNAPEANLYNGAGLPAVPFRSDAW
jgi:sialate O-acetylesterase